MDTKVFKKEFSRTAETCLYTIYKLYNVSEIWQKFYQNCEISKNQK